jgi:hypothetical protein
VPARRGLRSLGLALSLPLVAGAAGCSSIGARSGAPQVEFIVTGSAPNGVAITYGDDASNYRTRTLPMDITKPIRKHTLYWVMAQLQGGGRITCKVIIGKTVRAGHAIGAYNTCTAQSPKDTLGGWN